ncbi:MAG: glyceraldehyde 3-phosphate dehydrogenase NAD-binding domain-containing protein, partial [Flavobacteriales bacterium]
MANKKVAINGFGRIGRITARIILEKEDIDLVAINDLTDTETLAHLFKYDTIHGKYNGEISAGDGFISVNGQKIRTYSEKDPANLPWKRENIDVVIESTGAFRNKDEASKHLNAGASKVIISAPPKDEEIQTVVLGIN